MIEKLPENLRRYAKIALAMNKYEIGEEVSITRLAEEAGVHFNTAKKAVAFFYNLNQIGIPDITLVTKETIVREIPMKVIFTKPFRGD